MEPRCVLVICEKPSVAKDVATALHHHRFTKTGWGYQSDTMWVTAAAGHLVAELEPEKYDDRWKTWDFDQLPMLPTPFKYKPRDKNAATRLTQLAALITDPAVTGIINACDAGREGELIFKLILQYSRTTKPVERAWFSSMTPAAIQKAFNQLEPDDHYIPLESAARSRSEADWYVGMNATRAASLTLGGTRQLLTLGRVQTPTLALIVRRDLDIEQFQPAPYHRIKATFTTPTGDTYDGYWRSGTTGDTTDRFTTRPDAEQIAARSATGTGTVETVETKTETINPPKLFDLNGLQRAANQQHGYTAAKTLQLAQTLYETHKILSYPRTDSCYITTDMGPTIDGLLHTVAATPTYTDLVTHLTTTGYDPAVIINDNKVTDHHGLLPTDTAPTPGTLNPDETRIYDLVIRRFIAALLPPQLVERTTIWTVIDSDHHQDRYRTTGSRTTSPGWQAAYPETDTPEHSNESDEDTEPANLPTITQQDPVTPGPVTVTDHTTKPAPRWTEASLLGAMATAGKLVESAEQADAMKDSGLGTPATRASIIERLINVGYIERKGRQLVGTDKGRGLIIALGDHPLTHPDLTGQLERQLRAIERSPDPNTAISLRQQFMADIQQFVTNIVTEFAGLEPTKMLSGRKIIAPCPVPNCDGDIIESKRGWGCTSYQNAEHPGCGFTVWKQQNGKRTTEKGLQTHIRNVAAGTITITPPQPRKKLGPCPIPGCTGTIVSRPKSFGCDTWKPDNPGCGYVLWRTNPDGTELTEPAALDLIAAGKTNAKPPPPKFADCPRCGPDGPGYIVEREKAYGCTSWKPSNPGCGTTIWKTQNKQPITETQARDQLTQLVGTTAPPRKRSTRTKR